MDLETDLRLPARRVVEVKAVAGPDLWLDDEFQMLCPFLALFFCVCLRSRDCGDSKSVCEDCGFVFFFFFPFVLYEVLRWGR